MELAAGDSHDDGGGVGGKESESGLIRVIID